MTAYMVVDNAKLGRYEIHAAGCKHSNLRHIRVIVDVVPADVSGTLAEVEAYVEGFGDGIWAAPAPCTRTA